MNRIHVKNAIIICVSLLVLPVFSFASENVYSDLWDSQGENWTPASRLPDFSYAGYHCGQSDLPLVPTAANVKSFGAKGDGKHDDTQAFIDAIEKTKAGAIYIPPGRYKITKIIYIQKPNLVLRGAGPDRTVLFCPVPLNKIKPNWGETTSGKRTSNYSWSGGMIWVKGGYSSQKLADITSKALRGDKQLSVSSTADLKPGMRVEIFVQDDRARSLTDYLYSSDTGDISKYSGSTGSFVVTLKKVKGTRITFDRPLRFDIRPQWKPQLRRFAPTVTEVGIENLSFEFPNTSYGGHFTELGQNAVAINGAADCWVRNIMIKNSDSGLFIGARFCTFSGITFQSQRKPNRGCTGHHGVTLGGTDNLFTDFDFQNCFIHDLTVSKSSAGNVFSDGKGVDISFDHHKRAPYENLFTNIDIGKGSRMFKCGGGQALGKNSGARETFWNIRASQPQKYPPDRFGPPSMNLVAVKTDQPSQKDPKGKWFEAIDPIKIIPQNIHKAQLNARQK